MSHSPEFTEQRIVEALEADGSSCRDYILVGTPPSICRWSAGAGLWVKIIEDDALAQATVAYLQRHGARSFTTVDAVKKEFD